MDHLIRILPSSCYANLEGGYASSFLNNLADDRRPKNSCNWTMCQEVVIATANKVWLLLSGLKGRFPGVFLPRWIRVRVEEAIFALIMITWRTILFLRDDPGRGGQATLWRDWLGIRDKATADVYIRNPLTELLH